MFWQPCWHLWLPSHSSTSAKTTQGRSLRSLVQCVPNTAFKGTHKQGMVCRETGPSCHSIVSAAIRNHLNFSAVHQTLAHQRSEQQLNFCKSTIVTTNMEDFELISSIWYDLFGKLYVCIHIIHTHTHLCTLQILVDSKWFTCKPHCGEDKKPWRYLQGIMALHAEFFFLLVKTN